MIDLTLIPEPDEAAVEALAQELGIGKSTARAALLLDNVVPGWDENIHLPELQMWSVSRCVLGYQLNVHPYFADCDGWTEALEKLGDAIGSQARIDDAGLYNFSHSTSEFVTLIEARRAVQEG